MRAQGQLEAAAERSGGDGADGGDWEGGEGGEGAAEVGEEGGCSVSEGEGLVGCLWGGNRWCGCLRSGT